MSDPKLALKNWEEIAGALRAGGPLALLSDFDGTLAGIAEHPGAVRIPAGTRATLRALSGAGVLTGIISGRGLRDVQRRVDLAGIWYSGSHGLAIAEPGGRRHFLASARQRDGMDRLAAQLRRQMAGRTGLWVETKDGCLAVHYRRANLRDRIYCHQAMALTVAAGGDGTPEVVLRPGKCVWEILPRAPHSKWSALKHILRQARFASRGTVLYLGDDVADEEVFRRLGEARRGGLRTVSVVVAGQRASQAQYRLRSVEEVALFLGRLREVMA
jgi:trehalose 6-phosphate phosphatase